MKNRNIYADELVLGYYASTERNKSSNQLIIPQSTLAFSWLMCKKELTMCAASEGPSGMFSLNQPNGDESSLPRTGRWWTHDGIDTKGEGPKLPVGTAWKSSDQLPCPRRMREKSELLKLSVVHQEKEKGKIMGNRSSARFRHLLWALIKTWPSSNRSNYNSLMLEIMLGKKCGGLSKEI